MALLGMDLGGTKLSMAVFTDAGSMIRKETAYLAGRGGAAVGRLINDSLSAMAGIAEVSENGGLRAIGVSVPGIYRSKTGTVWAPNIPGWDDYPLLDELRSAAGAVPVLVDSDRACYVLGESWQGNLRGCADAIYLAVGTGIGAGILVNGQILRGAQDIAGAIGWMGLDKPFRAEYIRCGCFEYHASGEGIARTAGVFLQQAVGYSGSLSNKPPAAITAHDVFQALDEQDALAAEIIQACIAYWGMAVANLVSLFNPEKIILGGGIFGPAVRFIPDIAREAMKWAQPVSVHQYRLEASALGADAGVYGAGFLALKQLTVLNSRP